MKKTIVFLLLVGIVSIFFYMKWKSPKVQVTIPDKIMVGTSADFQPFCYKENNEIVGFDIDIAKEVANRLNKAIEFKDMPFELLIPQLQLGTLHMVAACMTPTPERAQRVGFSQPYLTGDHLVVVSRADAPPIKNLADLTGKRVIVNQGYNADRYMSNLQGPELIRLPTVSDAMLALTSGRADAFVTASKAVQPFFDQAKEKFNTFVIPDATETTALALSPLHPTLAEKVESALQDMKADGTIEKLKEKWRLHD